MAEVLATMMVGPLLSMVKEKASSYLLEQYKVMEGMEKNHEILKRKLPAILDVITDAEEQAAAHREGAKSWLEALRKVAYKANDLFDEFKYEALRREAKEKQQYKQLGMDVIKLFPSYSRTVFRCRMGNKLHMILNEIEVLITEMNAFRFEFKPPQPMSTDSRMTDSDISNLHVDIANKSRAQEKDEIVDALIQQANKKELMVLPIVGMGGLGKTTLAKLIYNDQRIQTHFQLRLWVYVSDNFEVDSLEKRILEAAAKEKNDSATSGTSTLDSIKEVVNGKRYLLVLDDVWKLEDTKWKLLKSYLQHGGRGCSVLTTTRNANVARLMGTTEACDLKILEDSYIKEIIESRAFGSQKGPDALVKLVDEIVKRCAGSPLAASALGSVLHTKTKEEEWKAIIDRSILSDEENGILPILKLSYNSLPSYMRQCFAFCAMFPKDYVISVDMLIQLWMANGLIPVQQGVSPEITGQKIFLELASRSFFHKVKQVSLDRDSSPMLEGHKHSYCSRITCKIHDLMHDVALSAMGKDCAAIATELSNKDFPQSARHLYLSVHKPDTLLNDSREKESPAIQTLICEGDVNENLQHLSKYKYIRALKTQQCSFLKPKYLRHLRYLDLSESSIEALPEDLTILYHLEALNLSGCRYLDRLPKEMKYMTALRHLYTTGCLKLKSMPADLRHLTSLRTLTWFIAGTGSECSNLKQLCQLDLGGQLELRRLENVTEADATEADLGTRKKLTELTLRWIDHGKETWHNHRKVLENLKPHGGLEILRIHSYWGDTFPTWMSSLQGMLELELSDCKNIKKLPPIWTLPSLKVLRLSSLDNLYCLCTGNTNTPFIFHKLEELALFDMPNFETWCEVHVEEPIFPQLKKLSIWKCERLTALPKSSDGVDTVWCSAFPKLKEQESKDLGNLATLQKWVTGPLVSMVKEKASSYLLEQYQVMEGMEKNHEILKRKLPAILDIITDAEEQAAAQRDGAKAWLEALRKVAYQANDVFDEFIYEARRREAVRKGHYKELGADVIKLLASHNQTAFRYRMNNKLIIILNAIEVLIAGMVDIGFRPRPRSQVSMNKLEIVHSIIEPMHIESRARDDEKQNVVKALLAQASNVDLTVLPIVGMGGVGKTTLAQLVYNDPVIQRHFQLLLWVCVTDNNDFDVDFLARSIVKAATIETSGSETSGAAPLIDLQKVVNGKRFLLVLDDVCNPEVSKWENLKSCLQDGGNGSSVLITTRDQFVARIMGTTEAYYLASMDKRFIEEIIKTKAIGSREKIHDELFEMADYVEKIGASSPLAARALISVLRANITVDEWKTVLSISKSFDEENGVLPILNLSYNCLPSHIRQCFAFCAMFPKGYEIDVEMLIQLWIANGFIPEHEWVCPERIGERIFNNLVSRSFFQDVNIVPFDEELSSMVEGSKHMSSSRMTCSIHDLMHDVAQSATGKECVTIATGQSQSEDFLYSARHLFLSVEEPETILNASHEKGSLAIQTLICEVDVKEDLQQLSKYSSLRALRLKGGSFPNPKYLHHLRYLDLSDSHISALPEDISTLYHLQTLNLSGCCELERLPKGMKYMSALHHLYTHGCSKLNSMPSGFGHLTSLLTLTCFVAGPPGSGCSKVGELGRLDNLGGQLELRQLENVKEEDAKAVNLENKNRLAKLTLRWTDGNNNEAQYSDEKLLEGLEPHYELKVLRIYSYRGHTCPFWMNKLQGTEVLELSGCKWLNELPALCRLPALQVLCLRGLESLYFLCSGHTLFPFHELRVLILSQMPKLGTLWDTNAVQGKEPIFPQLENLSIEDCKSLVALPKAFPALKEIKLCSLEIFQRWEADEETQGEGGVTFPQLENLNIQRCPKLTILPEAPQLSVLEIDGGNQQMSLQVASRYITSLSKLELKLAIDDRETTLQAEPNSIEFVHGMVKSNHVFPMKALELGWCNFLFSHASALTLWAGFAQLVDLKIMGCDALVNWPYEVFQNLVSLRTLQITGCCRLKGHSQASEPPVPEWSGFLPCLEFLEIIDCESLVEVPHLPASLKNLLIKDCKSCKYIVFGQPKDTRLVSADDAVCLESLTIESCGGLIEVHNLPPSIRTLNIDSCSNLQFLSGQLDALQTLRISSCSELKTLEYCLGELLSLEKLELHDCRSLVSLPNGRQTYSSLRVLRIESCSGVKLLPSNLRQRLHHLEGKTLDARYEEAKTWKYKFNRMSRLK